MAKTKKYFATVYIYNVETGETKKGSELTEAEREHVAQQINLQALTAYARSQGYEVKSK